MWLQYTKSIKMCTKSNDHPILNDRLQENIANMEYLWTYTCNFHSQLIIIQLWERILLFQILALVLNYPLLLQRLCLTITRPDPFFGPQDLQHGTVLVSWLKAISFPKEGGCIHSTCWKLFQAHIILQTGMWHDLRVLAGMGQNNVREYINNYTMPDNCKINALAVFSLVGYLWICTCSKVTAISLSEKGQLM